MEKRSHIDEIWIKLGKYGNKDYTSHLRSVWDLVCDKDALGKMSQTLVSGGMFLGAFASPLADKFGRRPVHCAFNLGYFIVTILIAFVTNFKAFMVLRFLTGVCQQNQQLLTCGSLNFKGMLLTVFTLWIEMFPTENRTMIGILNGFMWNSSFFLVLPFAYLLKDFGWRIIQLGLSLLSAIAVIEYWYVLKYLPFVMFCYRKIDTSLIPCDPKMSHILQSPITLPLGVVIYRKGI
ncbi:hypothetical protein KUTeg_018484 [Tegillarca granosa]|uniref:Major facilitator superfamily (MFS) profile domain-containing protein n=1 Tax=Tegillarca granosa TaxID=220873 RepID=A0ABQ9ELZ1_TEGGR|nr:hypothetical protein KUTeg_018484 [Tegillarca granosa]